MSYEALYALSRSPYSDVPLLSTSDHLDGSVQYPLTRFVQLKSAEDGTIECTLRVANLSEVCEFEALSYTWGPAMPTESILLNGKTFGIRRNLWQALNTILSDRKTRQSMSPYLWVDAISIDQTNVLERNHQVHLMPRIFSKAKLVLVWIGSYGPDVDIAVQEITAHKPWRPNQGNLDHLTPTTMGSLRTLFSQAYWTRMWIIQEFVMAKDMRFFYGNGHFNWNHFRLTMLYLDDSSVAIHCQTHVLAAVRESYQYIRNSSAFSIYRTRKLYKELSSFDVFELVRTFQKQECSDPRDKIFALLGVAANTRDIRADYTLSKEMLLNQLLDGLSRQKSVKESHEEMAALLGRILRYC
jgi:hypothetical protein